MMNPIDTTVIRKPEEECMPASFDSDLSEPDRRVKFEHKTIKVQSPISIEDSEKTLTDNE